MSKVLNGLKRALTAVLPLLALLKKPGVATGAAGLILPLLTVLGVTNLSLAELGADIVVFGGVAATLERVLPGGLLHPSPVPPAPPAPAPKGKRS